MNDATDNVSSSRLTILGARIWKKENFQLNFESIVFVLILVVELYFLCLAQLLVCGIYINS